MFKQTIELHKAVVAPLLTPVFVQRILQAVQRQVHLPTAWKTISVVAVGDAAMRKLNQQHRQANYIPDVLSFPYGDDGGEVVICYPQMRRQAQHKQVLQKSELAWLLVHGILHIAGYDHETTHDAQIMRPLEQKILAYV